MYGSEEGLLVVVLRKLVPSLDNPLSIRMENLETEGVGSVING